MCLAGSLAEEGGTLTAGLGLKAKGAMQASLPVHVFGEEEGPALSIHPENLEELLPCLEEGGKGA